MLNRVEVKLKKKLIYSGVQEVIYKPIRKKSLRSIFEKASKVVSPVKEFNSQLPKLNVLVAEDNPVNQKLITRMLNRLDLKVTVANNGKEALSMLQIENYDLVLMDMQMPEMDGCTASKYIRTQLLMDLPIIAMTANALLQHRDKFFAAGMNDFISKPIQKERLWQILNKYGRQVKTKNAESEIIKESKEIISDCFLG
jgi:CheY-like chemotaxis protein